VANPQAQGRGKTVTGVTFVKGPKRSPKGVPEVPKSGSGEGLRRAERRKLRRKKGPHRDPEGGDECQSAPGGPKKGHRGAEEGAVS
jgi:hypothetical protein